MLPRLFALFLVLRQESDDFLCQDVLYFASADSSASVSVKYLLYFIIIRLEHLVKILARHVDARVSSLLLVLFHRGAAAAEGALYFLFYIFRLVRSEYRRLRLAL